VTMLADTVDDSQQIERFDAAPTLTLSAASFVPSHISGRIHIDSLADIEVP
jgi:hypothetical protein